MNAQYSDQVYDVELRAVTKRFGSLTAVNAVTLKVYKGEFLSLLGPSGCGKATVLAVIITAVVLRRSRVQATPAQEQAPGLDAALGLR